MEDVHAGYKTGKLILITNGEQRQQSDSELCVQPNAQITPTVGS